MITTLNDKVTFISVKWNAPELVALKAKAELDPELDHDVLHQYSSIDPVLFKCNDVPVGFALPRLAGIKAELYRTGPIFVLPKYRKLGIAKQWITEFFQDKKGVAYIRKGNKASEALFTSCGFKATTKTLTVGSDLFIQYKKT